MTDLIKTVLKYKTLDGYTGWIIKIRRVMEIAVKLEEYKGKVIGVSARKLPPDYEPNQQSGTVREFVVEVEDYRPDERRDAEWKEIKKKMKKKAG